MYTYLWCSLLVDINLFEIWLNECRNFHIYSTICQRAHTRLSHFLLFFFLLQRLLFFLPPNFRSRNYIFCLFVHGIRYASTYIHTCGIFSFLIYIHRKRTWITEYQRIFLNWEMLVLPRSESDQNKIEKNPFFYEVLKTYAVRTPSKDLTRN